RIESELPCLLELAGRREVEISAAVGLHGTGFLTRDVVLVPGRPDLHHLVQLSHAWLMLPTAHGASNEQSDDRTQDPPRRIGERVSLRSVIARGRPSRGA